MLGLPLSLSDPRLLGSDAVALCLLVACGTDDEVPVLFPADYLASYTEVRDCRKSADHDLHNIRILADPVALASYQNRDAPFPIDAKTI